MPLELLVVPVLVFGIWGFVKGLSSGGNEREV